MTQALQVLFTLLSVVVGAVTSFIVTRANSHAQWRREISVRWDSKRLETYAAYGAAVRHQQQLVMSVGAWRGFTARLIPIDPEEGIGQIAEADAKRAAKYEELLLIGEPEVIASARRYHQAVWYLDWFARGHFTEGEKWALGIQELEAARAAYYSATRHNLGVAGPLPAVPRPSWFSDIPQGSAPDGFRDT